ncbi:efflux RND transporter periplasmic adaptor subunit [Methylosinus sp. Sm6]|uniref:efflux RND transporter periplasmic adaptor subunit n=1 Tax=Methylosinus sp. Sm6 TaxID=2866948 RepID=UPI001C9936FB|nr:efflux RND transporter periplasmic adaptor subunit [Methylosinus sp. Sm6]MBY6240617.1 efflux RND transporter periplasmic adaptor subunit [Methylosinus sp. Sm6]
MRRFGLGAALAAAVALGAALPPLYNSLRSWLGTADEALPAAAAEDGLVPLSAAQIAAARIETALVAPGMLARAIVAPAMVAVDPDRIGKVAAKVAGTIAELRKKLGDPVEKGEIVAVIDSREVADAKSDYLAALVQLDLQSALFQREKGLFEKKIAAEQSFLKARSVYEEARLRADLARQKLAALDLSDEDIAELPRQKTGALRSKDIRAPAAGRVIERRVHLGQPVGGEGQEKELYQIADLSVVIAEISVAIADLADLREGQRVRLAHGGEEDAEGRIVFIRPTIDHETHSGRAIASFSNEAQKLRAGASMTARVFLAEREVPLRIPRAALLSFEGDPIVFVRAPEGFVKRKVTPGESDREWVEILSGLEPGEQVAASNVFVLKAELGKARLEGLD